MIDLGSKTMSIREQCQLFGINRSSFYYTPVQESMETIGMMHLLDAEHTKHPFYGVLKMTEHLRSKGFDVGKDRVRTLLRKMGLYAIYPKPNFSKRNQEHKIYPYLLRGLRIIKPNQVWCADITYIRLLHGFAYLVAIMDWYSRYVLSWQLSNTLDSDFCILALEEAFRYGKPDIFNSDQGTQFTSLLFTARLLAKEIAISMDSRGSFYNNIFVERLWRSVKYEDIYIKGYETIPETSSGLSQYFPFYNNERYHQSLNNKAPVYFYLGHMNPGKEIMNFSVV